MQEIRYKSNKTFTICKNFHKKQLNLQFQPQLHHLHLALQWLEKVVESQFSAVLPLGILKTYKSHGSETMFP